MRAADLLPTSLLACLGCVSIPRFAEDRAFASSDETGVTLIADNDGATLISVHFPNDEGRAHFPDRIAVSSAEIGGARELLGGGGIGFSVDGVVFNAGTSVDASSNPAPIITLAGPGLAQVQVAWKVSPGAPTDGMTGTSTFTMFPDGRLIRSDRFATSTTPHEVRATIDLNRATPFGSFYSPPTVEVAIPVPTSEVVLDRAGVCLESTEASSSTLGLAWLGDNPVGTSKLTGSVANFGWPARAGEFSLTTVIYGVPSPRMCVEDVASNLDAQVAASVLATTGGSATPMATMDDEGVYVLELDPSLDDIVIEPNRDTAEGFALALAGERIDATRLRVVGKVEAGKGPPLVEKHRLRDRTYVWIPSTVAAGTSIRVQLR
jgi:hypothetical protein